MSDETQHYYILKAYDKNGNLKTYSVSAHNEQECRAIFEDFKDEGEFFSQITETVKPHEYSRSKL